MHRPSLEDILPPQPFNPKRVAVVAADLRSGKTALVDEKNSDFSALMLFTYGHLRGHPERFEQSRPLLDALVELGQSPFDFPKYSHPSIYLEMLADDESHPIVSWCLDLPCAPPSQETDPQRRLRFDSLTHLLMENPLPGSPGQTSTLALFDFKLLEKWADGKTTLDHILARYYQHQVVQGKAPHKDFEFAHTQRGFTRLLNLVLREDAQTPHAHAIRWHAWHHAHLAHERLHKGGFYREWGTETWQAALRQLDKTLARSLGIANLPQSERDTALWQQSVDYALSRPPDAKLPAVLAGAGWYDLLDSVQRFQSECAATLPGGRRPGAKPPKLEGGLLRALDVGSAMVHAWTGSSEQEVLGLFAESVGLVHFSRALIDQLPSSPIPPEVLEHPALVPCVLPLLVKDSLWSSQAENFHAALIEGAVWPSGAPWTGFSACIHWPQPVRACLDTIDLQSKTPLSSRSTTRRM